MNRMTGLPSGMTALLHGLFQGTFYLHLEIIGYSHRKDDGYG
jgi:hypothetical protein